MSDLLAYLGVTVPPEPLAQAAPATSASTFLRSKAAPPIPRLAPTTPRPPRIASSPAPSASPKVVTINPDEPPQVVQRWTPQGPVEYVVLDAPVPCNLAVNAAAATARRERQERQRQAEAIAEASRAAQEKQWAAGIAQQAVAAKLAQQEQLQHWEQQRRGEVERAAAEAAARKIREREVMDRLLEHTVEAERTQRAQRVRAAERVAEHQAREAAEKAGQRAAALRQQHLAPAANSLPLDTWSVAPEVVAETRERLRSSWQQQCAERERRAAEQRAADAAAERRTAEHVEAAARAEDAAMAQRRQQQKEALLRHYESSMELKTARQRQDEAQQAAAAALRLAPGPLTHLLAARAADAKGDPSVCYDHLLEELPLSRSYGFEVLVAMACAEYAVRNYPDLLRRRLDKLNYSATEAHDRRARLDWHVEVEALLRRAARLTAKDQDRSRSVAQWSTLLPAAPV